MYKPCRVLDQYKPCRVLDQWAYPHQAGVLQYVEYKQTNGVMQMIQAAVAGVLVHA